MSTRTRRHIPVLLLALIALALVARPAAASEDGFQIRTEGAYAEFSFIDETTGYVTDVTVYAADDQGYRAFGDTGEPERISKVNVSVTQYDAECLGGGPKLDAQAGGGGGDPTCFYQNLQGIFPGKDTTEGLPEDAFAVSMPRLDGAWLSWTLTLSGWGPDGEVILPEVTINLAWTPTGDVYPVRHNSLAHYPPSFVSTAHVNAQQVDALATGALTFRGETHNLTSSYAAIFDAQQINT